MRAKTARKSSTAVRSRSAMSWPPRPSRCPIPTTEPLLVAIVRGLFAEGAMPPGSVVDAGANDGTEACVYAESSPDRVVHAIEPLKSNIAAIHRLRRVVNMSNIQPLMAGLGNASTAVIPEAKPQAQPFGPRPDAAQLRRRRRRRRLLSNTQITASSHAHAHFSVYRLDDLFAATWADERLGFAHFDLEGFELSVLQGARKTIERDRPIFTAEIFVHNRPRLTAAVLRFAEVELAYRAYVVEEQCGIPADCRNALFVPKELVPLLRRSPTLDIAANSGHPHHSHHPHRHPHPHSHNSGVLIPTDADTVNALAYGPVCDARDGRSPPCCGGTNATTFEGGGVGWCCKNACVQRWLTSLDNAGFAALGARAGSPPLQHSYLAWAPRGAPRERLFGWT